MEPSAQKAERRPPRAARPPGARFPTRGWGNTSLGAAASSAEQQQSLPKRRATAAQRPQREAGRAARKRRPAGTLPPPPPGPERRYYSGNAEKAGVFRLLARPAAHCSPAGPPQLPLAPAGFSRWPPVDPLPARSACGVPSSALRCRHSGVCKFRGW